MPHSKKTSTHQLEASGLFCGSFVASAHRRDTGERAAPPAAAEGPPGAEPDFSGRFTGGWWYGPQGHGEVAAARIRYPVCIFFTTVSESTNGSTCTRYDTSLIHKIRFPKIRFMFISQSIVIVIACKNKIWQQTAVVCLLLSTYFCPVSSEHYAKLCTVVYPVSVYVPVLLWFFLKLLITAVAVGVVMRIPVPCQVCFAAVNAIM